LFGKTDTLDLDESALAGKENLEIDISAFSYVSDPRRNGSDNFTYNGDSYNKLNDWLIRTRLSLVKGLEYSRIIIRNGVGSGDHFEVNTAPYPADYSDTAAQGRWRLGWIWSRTFGTLELLLEPSTWTISVIPSGRATSNSYAPAITLIAVFG